MASLSGMVTGANTALGNALDKLKELKDNILGGFLSIPLVKTALVVAANIIIAVNVLKIIKKLPANISSLQTELLTNLVNLVSPIVKLVLGLIFYPR